MCSEFVPFKSYDEIPVTIKAYVTFVAKVIEVTEIPLEDINGFLADQHEYEKSQTKPDAAEWEDGWVI